jgi:methionyl-tRNA formyltransferase
MSKFSRILVFGTEIGIQQVLKSGEFDKIVGIVVPGIRPLEVQKVKDLAKSVGIPFFIQPKYSLKERYEEFVLATKNTNYNSVFSNCYSMIIRPDVLEYCNYNALNIHWSLLPLNRGPNPIQWALIRNEKFTGVTAHFIEDGIDTGDIVLSRQIGISDLDTWVSLSLSQMVVKDCLKQAISGSLIRRPQDESLVTINERLTPKFPKINFDTMSDREIFNLIRAQVSPLKGAYIEGEQLLHIEKYLSMKEVASLRKKYEQ